VKNKRLKKDNTICHGVMKITYYSGNNSWLTDNFETFVIKTSGRLLKSRLISLPRDSQMSEQAIHFYSSHDS
jgi:hypothetical protein